MAVCGPEDAEKLAKNVVRNEVGKTEAFPDEELPFSLETDEVMKASTAQKNRVLGFISSARTMRGAFNDFFRVHAIDPLIKLEILSNNFVSKEFKEFKNATKELRGYFGMSHEMDIKLNDALGYVDRTGVYTGPKGAFEDKVINAAVKVRGIYNRLAEKHGISEETYLDYYRPLLRQRPSGIFYDPQGTPAEVAFRGRLRSAKDIKFYHELERKGMMVVDGDPTATAGFTSYVRGIANADIKKPGIQALEENFVNKHFGLRYSRDIKGNLHLVATDEVGYGMWKELVHNVFGGPTPLDKNLTRNFQRLAAMFGVTTDTRAVYKFTHGLTGAFFGGAMGSPLGGRPSSVIRQLFQLVPTYAELGGKYSMMGIEKAMRTGTKADLIERGLLSSPIEGLAESIGIAKGAGKVVSDITENFLKVFGAVDQFTRAATAYGAEAKFNDYMARGIIEKLGGKQEFKDAMLRLVKKGDQASIDKAREMYMFETVGNLQYFYGKANKPELFRGAVGNLLGVLMSYPMNSLEMMRMFTQRALPTKFGGQGDFVPLVRLMLTSGALVGAGSEFLNADLRSATMLGAVPHGLAIPKIACNTFQAGTSSVEWLTGSLFQIGETDYHKAQRIQNYREFARDMRTFVPGGVFFFEDIPRAIGEGSLARMLALTPKAADINEMAKQRVRENRAAAGVGGGGLRGLGGGL